MSGSLRTLTEHADSAFEMLALAVREPRFDNDAIERVRSQIISGLKRDETDPQSLTRDALNRLAFPGHPYGHPSDGRIADVQATTRDDLKALHGRLFARDVLRVVSVGAISPEAVAAGVRSRFRRSSGDGHASCGAGNRDACCGAYRGHRSRCAAIDLLSRAARRFPA